MFCFVVFPLPFFSKRKAISLGTVTLKVTLDGNNNLIAKNYMMDWVFFFFFNGSYRKTLVTLKDELSAKPKYY